MFKSIGLLMASCRRLSWWTMRWGSEGCFHLIEAGHKRIGILSGSLMLPQENSDLLDIGRALKEHGIPSSPELVKSGSFRHDHAIEDVRGLINVSPLLQLFLPLTISWPKLAFLYSLMRALVYLAFPWWLLMISTG